MVAIGVGGADAVDVMSGMAGIEMAQADRRQTHRKLSGWTASKD